MPRKRLGVGTYRMVAGNALHEACLRRALGPSGAFRVVDTSPNYGDGLAEELVGKVVEELGARPRVKLMSKFGFIQGRSLEEHLKDGRFGDAVKYTDDCYYSIQPEFMRAQLGESLARLRTSKLDTYLVHNPEHVLMAKYPSDLDIAREGAHGKDLVRGERQKLNAMLTETFVALEEQVKAGSIGDYGVSSNSFALPTDHPYFLDFSSIEQAAVAAAERVGTGVHSMRTFQLPGNAIERTGLTPTSAGGNGLVQFARKAGISTVVNRALTAFDKTGSWRLAETNFPPGYAASRERLLDHLSPAPEDTSSWPEAERREWEETLEASAWLTQLITDLDAQMGAFTSVMHYQDDLTRKIVPMINAKLEGMDEDTSGLLFAFFAEFERGVRSVAGEQTRNHLLDDLAQDGALAALKGPTEDFVPPLLPLAITGDHEPLQRYALRWLLQQPCVDTVLLGAVRPEYVDEAGQILAAVNGEALPDR